VDNEQLTDIIRTDGFYVFVEAGDLIHRMTPVKDRFLESEHFRQEYFAGARSEPGGSGFDLEKPALACVQHVANIAKRPAYLDIGCQYGISSMQIARIAGKDAQVHAFDPGRASSLVLANFMNNGFSQIRFHKMACGSFSGWGLILGEKGNSENNRAGFVGRPDFSFPARFVRIDDIDFGEPDVLFVKIDTQGFEPEVFDGAAKTFRIPSAIVAEYTPWAIRERRDPVRWLSALAERFEIYTLWQGACEPVTDIEATTRAVDESPAHWCDLILLSHGLPNRAALRNSILQKPTA
jgi:FkbM family methyltransferase